MNRKSLICINTCNRFFYLKWFSPDYLKFCNKNNDFDFVVSLDGNDEEYKKFCLENRIPLLWSEERLGVGISKNRVLEAYPDYDYYFFLDDDAELLKPEVFNIIIRLSDKSGIPHFSLGAGFGFKGELGQLEVENFKIYQTKYGSGQFSFFRGEALRQVGGWHPLFATYKRGGHTEHTYRFYHAGLSKAPFHFIEHLNNGYMNWHSPYSVTKLENVKTSINSRLQDEEDLIEKKMKYHSVETLTAYHESKFPLVIDRDDISFNKKQSEDYILKIIDHPFFTSEEKSKAITMYLNERDDIISAQAKELEKKKALLNLIENSGSYKVAKGIAKPISLFRNLIS